jgi:hypothetical protein
VAANNAMRLTAAVAFGDWNHLRRPVNGRESMFDGPEVPIWGAGWVPKLVARAGYLLIILRRSLDGLRSEAVGR